MGSRPGVLENARTVLYTPTIYVASRKLDDDLRGLCRSLDWAIQDHRHPDAEYVPSHQLEAHAELVVVDEADRLKTATLEINRLHTINAEVVDAARETLVIGQP